MNQKPARETSKAIIAYPTMDEENIEWIENLRQTHDNRNSYSVHPDLKHLFFVFHELSIQMEQSKLIQSIEENFADFAAFNFTIRYSIMHEVYDIGGFSIDFVPTEGIESCLNISSIIHTKILTKYNSFQIIPHIPISGRKRPSEAKDIMNLINQQEIEIKGRIEKLSIKEWKLDRTIPVIHEFTLKSRP